MRVGILTGGGDCPGLNAVIRAVAKGLIVNCGAEIVGFEQGFLGLIERKSRPLSYRDVSGILDEGGTILGTHNKANPMNYFGAEGADVSDRVLDYYKELDLDGIVVLGGDGTMSICHDMSQKGMNFIGVPKTIDNDLMQTDRTFGFDTAVAIATECIDRLQTTGQSHGRVMIVETMGRYTGWLALYSGIAGAADIILIPEIPYEIDEIARICEQRAAKQGFTIIAVAEGARPRDGEVTVRETIEGSPDPVRLGGVGNVIKLALEERIDQEIRTTVLGHIQRGGPPTAFDRILATQFGCYAAALVTQKAWGHMVALQDNRLTRVKLEEVANQTRYVDTQAMSVISALSIGASFGTSDLAHPLSSLPDQILAV